MAILQGGERREKQMRKGESEPSNRGRQDRKVGTWPSDREHATGQEHTGSHLGSNGKLKGR